MKEYGEDETVYQLEDLANNALGFLKEDRLGIRLKMGNLTLKRDLTPYLQFDDKKLKPRSINLKLKKQNLT
ncbi:hypothetical protein MRB53_018134 [Persea americana]|uniref:Uncharacterized protein n=1 Tax=Persea americana TaxID=3435 RepID=A0ACC2M713_PERAE|nr:hypothetical protein MRB53_018134 [Persea americana]